MTWSTGPWLWMLWGWTSGWLSITAAPYAVLHPARSAHHQHTQRYLASLLTHHGFRLLSQGHTQRQSHLHIKLLPKGKLRLRRGPVIRMFQLPKDVKTAPMRARAALLYVQIFLRLEQGLQKAPPPHTQEILQEQRLARPQRRAPAIGRRIRRSRRMAGLQHNARRAKYRTKAPTVSEVRTKKRMASKPQLDPTPQRPPKPQLARKLRTVPKPQLAPSAMPSLRPSPRSSQTSSSPRPLVKALRPTMRRLKPQRPKFRQRKTLRRKRPKQTKVAMLSKHETLTRTLPQPTTLSPMARGWWFECGLGAEGMTTNPGQWMGGGTAWVAFGLWKLLFQIDLTLHRYQLSLEGRGITLLRTNLTLQGYLPWRWQVWGRTLRLRLAAGAGSEFLLREQAQDYEGQLGWGPLLGVQAEWQLTTHLSLLARGHVLYVPAGSYQFKNPVPTQLSEASSLFRASMLVGVAFTF